jgi:hypothetical protein
MSKGSHRKDFGMPADRASILGFVSLQPLNQAGQDQVLLLSSQASVKHTLQGMPTISSQPTVKQSHPVAIHKTYLLRLEQETPASLTHAVLNRIGMVASSPSLQGAIDPLKAR